jgi:hypothetical protein
VRAKPLAASVAAALVFGTSALAAHAGTSPARDPGTVRQAANDIVSGDEFQDHKSVLERFFEWLGDRLSFRIGGGGGPGLIGDLLTLALIVVAVVLVVRLIASRQHRAKRPAAVDDLQLEVERRRTADEWAADAERLTREGRHREALRARYRELVARLVDDGTIVDLAGRTTGELRIEVLTARPAAAASFSAATLLFEQAWYGGHSVDGDHVERLRQLAAEALHSSRQLVARS